MSDDVKEVTSVELPVIDESLPMTPKVEPAPELVSVPLPEPTPEPAPKPVKHIAVKVKKEDQKPVKAKDQKSAPAKDQKSVLPKKTSPTVVLWREQKGFEPNQVITILQKDKKTRGAAVRFAKYRTGMTVQGYIDVLIKEKLGTKASAMNDMRWDVASKFISIK
jgi:hypothetical protein